MRRNLILRNAVMFTIVRGNYFLLTNNSQPFGISRIALTTLSERSSGILMIFGFFNEIPSFLALASRPCLKLHKAWLAFVSLTTIAHLSMAIGVKTGLVVADLVQSPGKKEENTNKRAFKNYVDMIG